MPNKKCDFWQYPKHTGSGQGPPLSTVLWIESRAIMGSDKAVVYTFLLPHSSLLSIGNSVCQYSISHPFSHVHSPGSLNSTFPLSPLFFLKDTDHSNRLQGVRRFASYHLKENPGQCKQAGGQTSHNLSGWSKKKSLSLVSRFNLRKLRHTLAHKHNPCVNRFHPRTLHSSWHSRVCYKHHQIVIWVVAIGAQTKPAILYKLWHILGAKTNPHVMSLTMNAKNSL